MVQVVKRDGKVVVFEKANIIQAVTKAQKEVKNDMASLGVIVAINVLHFFGERDQVEIDEIQKLVEDCLMIYAPDVARAYIEYRSERDRVREAKSPLAKSIQGLITLSNKEITNENANKDAKVFPVQRDLLAGIVSKHFAHSGLLDDDIIAAHDSGDLGMSGYPVPSARIGQSH